MDTHKPVFDCVKVSVPGGVNGCHIGIGFGSEIKAEVEILKNLEELLLMPDLFKVILGKNNVVFPVPNTSRTHDEIRVVDLLGNSRELFPDVQSFFSMGNRLLQEGVIV
ncbi:hypothetical protein ES703_107624 [subsurface metagenome]